MVFYHDDPPITEGAYQGRVFTTPATLMVMTRDQRVWVLTENGEQVGEMPAGIYDVTGDGA
jgi:hypothetical protein